MTQDADTLAGAVQRAKAAYDALSPVDKALHDSDQRRSFLRGMCGDPGPDVLAEEVRRLRAEQDALRQAAGEQLALSISRGRERDEAIAERNRLAAENAQLRATLTAWQSRGCPDCGGDCGSANPPVALCIMRETAFALTGDTRHD